MSMQNVLSSDMSALPLMPIEDEKSAEQKEIELAQIEELQKLAAIPGWEGVKAQMLMDARNLRSHEGALSSVSFDSTTPDAVVGRMVRNELQLALWIEQYVSRIDAAVEAAKEANKVAELKNE